jgi:hypothetical protein
MAKWPSKSLKAPSFVLKWSPAFRCPLSGPWQAKHLSAKIGRMCLLKSTVLGRGWSAGVDAINATDAIRRLKGRDLLFIFLSVVAGTLFCGRRF